MKRLVPLLLLAALLPYLRVAGNGFVFDDFGYVLENERVRAGLTVENVRWAFTAFEMANWHPLTWLSHLADVSLFDIDAGRHHLVSLALHAVNTLLLCLALLRLTGARWRSFTVAALFAVHPLHVESVAWIAERKDLLSALFFLLALVAYDGYARRPSLPRYLGLCGWFCLALLAKPMVVTLPFVLLLLDSWPLGRGGVGGRSFAALLLEKVPLFALSAASAVVTVLAQRQGEAIGTLQSYSAVVRLENAAVSYARYLGKTLWPSPLSAFYRHPGGAIPAVQVGGALLLLLAATALALALARRRGYVPVGWLWFGGMLVPVIGILQVGSQAMADRYTYLPLVGVFLLLAWGGADLAARLRFPRGGLALAVAAALAALMAISWRQVGYWRDDIALFGHAVAVDPDNGLARNNLGHALNKRWRFREAEEQFREALRVYPDFYDALNNLGLVLSNLGRPREAIPVLQHAIRVKPRAAEAYVTLGLVFVGQRDRGAALGAYQALRAVDPKRAADLLQFVNTLPR
jgi:tetratricopeptide (TPR) repeat protein